MKRLITKRDQTIKCEIVQNKITKSKSFKIMEVSNHNVELWDCIPRRKSCYSQVFGYMNKFQIRQHNILPDFKTKQSTQDKETKETYRRQTQIAEDTVIRKFRRGFQELTKCNTVIQKLKLLQKKNQNISNFINKINFPSDRIIKGQTRRTSCYCSECGEQSQFQLIHQNNPFFNFFNYNEFLKRKIIKNIPKFQIKLSSQIQQLNLKKSYIQENKSQITKYKTISRTINQLIKLSQTKLSFQNQSLRIRTEITQYTPKSFKFQQNNNAQMRSRKLGYQSNFQSMISNQTKDSFRSLASVYK